MKPISPADAMFLLGESREHPMHVGGLQLFQPPAHARPDFIREAYEATLGCTDVQPTFRKHPAFLGGITNVAWSYDDTVELDYHVRLSALPRPGRIRDLLDLVSWLHGNLLDRHRPLWEAHIVEGLNDGRFAVYTKFHHALLDGVSAVKLMQRAFTTDPLENTVRVPWALASHRDSRGGQSPAPLRALSAAAGSAARLGPSTLLLAKAALVEQQLTLPFHAPKTMFNVAIGGARRVAAQSWPLDRVRPIRAATETTVNDVVLAMCAGALRGYLLEQNALPDGPLIALVPVSMRASDDNNPGNMVGAILCNLNTHIADPTERLAAIRVSMHDNKTVFDQLPRLQQVAFSATAAGGMALRLAPGAVGTTPPPFNIVISNVPGAPEPLYWRGARLTANYPVSIPIDGQAMNITVTSNAGNLDFGLAGCRRSVPHLQRMLGHLETSLKDLEVAVGT